jgi:DNA-binding response OmpR family regulator
MMNPVKPLQGKRILLIEDEYLVAQVVVEFLEEAGAEVAGPFGRVDDALAFIANSHSNLDAAVLDVNLHGEKSYPIADALAANNVIFVLTTGYGGDALDGRYLGVPPLRKALQSTVTYHRPFARAQNEIEDMT